MNRHFSGYRRISLSGLSASTGEACAIQRATLEHRAIIEPIIFASFYYHSEMQHLKQSVKPGEYRHVDCHAHIQEEQHDPRYCLFAIWLLPPCANADDCYWI